MSLKITTIGLISIAATSILIAGPMKMGGSMKMSTGMMKSSVCSPYYSIELSTTQKDELIQLRSEVKTSMTNLKSTFTNPMIAATTNGNFDTAAFIEAAKIISNEKITLKADYKKLMYDVLTPEQQLVFLNNIATISTNESCSMGRRF